MKKITAILMMFMASLVYGLVSEGDAQAVIVERGEDGKIAFQVDGEESFADVDACAKYCYNRSWFRNQKSQWANLVNIRFKTKMSPEDRQYIGDRFVANKVYPFEIIWTEKGEETKARYKTDEKSFREKRILN
jgi:hypothetical protein